MIWLATHGERDYGPDPLMNANGIAQIQALILPPQVSVLLYGTGRRFCQMRDLLLPRLKMGIKSLPSPFCGSADGLEQDQSIILTDGTTIAQDQYLGLVNATKGGSFQPWKFLRDLPNETLICAGGEFMFALDAVSAAKGKVFSGAAPAKGVIYMINPHELTSRLYD